jgi:hypothetical protein
MSIMIKNDKALIIKESLELEKNIIKLSIKEYNKEMKVLEKKHKMTTKKFIKRFNSGELGDESEWFDWLFAYKAYQHIIDRLSTIESISK